MALLLSCAVFGRQIYVPDAEVSWVEATITKGHLVNDSTVEVVLDGDESEEMADKHPTAGTVRKIQVCFIARLRVELAGDADDSRLDL